jgi:hypothetical protein
MGILNNSYGDIIKKSCERFWYYTSENSFSEQLKGQQ